MIVQGNTPAEINAVILDLQRQINELKNKIKRMEEKK